MQYASSVRSITLSLLKKYLFHLFSLLLPSLYAAVVFGCAFEISHAINSDKKEFLINRYNIVEITKLFVISSKVNTSNQYSHGSILI